MTTTPPLSGDWRNHAACRDEDPELFFPLGTSDAALVQAESATAVCARCPVREACLDWAISTGQDTGVWGGVLFMARMERATCYCGRPFVRRVHASHPRRHCSWCRRAIRQVTGVAGRCAA